jgi:hypothetical protein
VEERGKSKYRRIDLIAFKIPTRNQIRSFYLEIELLRLSFVNTNQTSESFVRLLPSKVDESCDW